MGERYTEEIWGHISRHQLPLNPLDDTLRRLGAPEHVLRVCAMIDGTRLEEDRIIWLGRGWPALFEELAAVLPRLGEYVEEHTLMRASEEDVVDDAAQ